ncbi:MAG: EpsI family protein [Deltaproteobacteria bacterium]|nr:EpsI family protein [Deltaproteobacteria bacterium]
MSNKVFYNLRFFTVLFLLISAFIFRLYWSPGTGVPLKKNFVDFPLEISGWKGRSATLDKEVLHVLGLTDYMMRDYVPLNSLSRLRATLPINLYVGYYASQAKGKTYHSPKNCLPGSGWELTGIDTVPVDFNGTTYKINKVLIQKGLEKQLVLYWFQDRGRVIASEYWAKIYLVFDSVMKKRTDGTFIRIMAPVKSSLDDTLKEEILFAKSMFPFLKEHLPD